MEGRELKKEFNNIASSYNFSRKFGGWFKESEETITVLDLQKSKYGNYYDLNIKVYIQDIFGKTYKIDKALVKDTGDIFRRQPSEYKEVFDLETPINDISRINRIHILFNDFIIPFVEEAATKKGILNIASRKDILLLPAVKKALLAET